MNNPFWAGSLLALFALTHAQAAAPSSAPADLQTARVALAAAVAAHDLKAITKLADFPLPIDAYRTAPKLTEAKFLADKTEFTNVFGDGDPSVVECLRKADASLQNDPKEFGAGSWVVDCNGLEYYFGQRQGHWRLVGYQNINE